VGWSRHLIHTYRTVRYRAVAFVNVREEAEKSRTASSNICPSQTVVSQLTHAALCHTVASRYHKAAHSDRGIGTVAVKSCATDRHTLMSPNPAHPEADNYTKLRTDCQAPSKYSKPVLPDDSPDAMSSSSGAKATQLS
jgi:hypothetical protein